MKYFLCLLLLVITAFDSKLFSQFHYSFALKKGVKLHYKGTLTTDTIYQYPTNRPFSTKEYNASITINDLVITIDTVINVADYTFVRFLFTPNQSAVTDPDSKVDVNLNLISSQEPRADFNLVFYKDEIYIISPNEGIANPLNFGRDDLARDSNSINRLDRALRNDYNLFYKKYLTANGCLKQMLDSRIISPDGTCKFIIAKDGQSCNFQILPFLNISSGNICTAKYGNEANQFFCLSKKDILLGDYGGKIKVFKEELNNTYLNSFTQYYYSDEFFISKMERDFKWDRAGHGQRRQQAPFKYTLILYKID